MLTLAVIGAGGIGREIAHQATVAGYRVILEDVLPNALRKAELEIHASLDHAIELGDVSVNEAEAATGRLKYAENVEDAARDANLVIETLPEELESKIEIFTLLDKICRPRTILASNTFSLSIAEIAGVTYRAKKCVGVRFVSPVHAMKTLEIVRAAETGDDTIDAIIEMTVRMKKKAIVIQESVPDLLAPIPEY